MNVLLSSTYFGPIQWYQKLCRAEHAWIERCESFQKQTYRNRCLIATTQGVQALTVPIVSERPRGVSEGLSLITSVRISDHGNWRHLHWNALQSAYGESPFFEYYEDDLRPFFEPRWEYLFDFNEAIRQKMCELLDIHPNVSFTRGFAPSATGEAPLSQNEALFEKNEALFEKKEALFEKKEAGLENSSTALCCGDAVVPAPSLYDYRSAIAPKHAAADPAFQPRRYYQVYEAKHGFLPNLSIVDLLCNMGPESVFWL